MPIHAFDDDAPARDLPNLSDGRLTAQHPGKVLVLTDDAARRAQLSLYLASRGHVVATAASEGDALRQLRAGGVALVIAAMTGSDPEGFEIVCRLRRAVPSLPVVVLARRGAELDRAHLDCVTDLGRGILDDACEKPNLLGSLTVRERQVFDLVVTGHANKVIAYKLAISPRTVENHRARMSEKLGARNVADLVRLALSTEQSVSRRPVDFATENGSARSNRAPLSA